MNSSRNIRHCLFAAFLALGFALVFIGCSKNSVPAVMNSDVFGSAPVELAASWNAARECSASSNYLGAVTNLMSVFSNSNRLTAEQTVALQEAWLEIGNQAFRAGEAGDQKAVQAVLAMRDSGFGKMKGER